MKYFIFFWFFFLSTVAFADGYSDYITLNEKRLQIIADSLNPRVFVYDVTIHNSGCSGSVPILEMSETNVLAKEMYSTLLTAKASGRELLIITKRCKYNNPKIFSIYLN